MEIDLEDSIENIAQNMSKEVSIYKHLDHPNIIKYYSSFVENSNLYIVMELIDGESLSDYIASIKEKGQRLVEGQIWRLFIEMCSGIRYLHLEKKVVHRDFTPPNIMITKRHHVKIADFGLAKQRGTHSSSHTQAFVGTILYSCPEIVRNRPYTEKADIWSLGVILYELATLQQPFTGENPLAIARKIVEEDYIKLEPGEYSSLLVNVVRNCMTVNPENRPDILHLCQMIGPLLMLQIDDLKADTCKLQSMLKQQNSVKPRALLPQVQIKAKNLRKVSDPVQPLLETLHKLVFITQLPPGLQRDNRRSLLENYKHWLFSEAKFAVQLKTELGKLHNCSREEVPIVFPEKVTYELLNFTAEELLTEMGYYEQREPATTEMLNSKMSETFQKCLLEES